MQSQPLPQSQQPRDLQPTMPLAAAPVTPCTPDSAGILISTAAGNAANEKRNNKTIMNCFRDRTTGYTRTNSRAYNKYERSVVGVGAGAGCAAVPQSQQQQPAETVIYLKEPRLRTNILTLLKSSSTRDLSHLMEDEVNISNTNTSSSCSSATSWEHKDKFKPSVQLSSNSSCSGNCKRELKQLQERVNMLEQNLEEQRTLTQNLESKLQLLSKRLEEVAELKPVKRKKSILLRKKSNTTNAPNVQPSKLVAWMNLSNLWKHRPSIETLKEKNIYNDEPCFDTEIEMVLKHETRKTIPKIVVDCCDLIEEKYRKSPSPIEGIYRQCGDYNKIQTLRFQIDANDYQGLQQANLDIHTLTGVLKLFLREIKSPLVSANEAKTFIGKPNQWLLTELPGKIEILRRLIRSLPEVNRDTMDYIFAHFNKLTKVPLQQISAETLAISVTPSIFHTVQEGVHIQDIHILLKESEVLADCVKIMIEYHNRIFECSVEWRQKRISVRRLKKTLSHPDLLFQNIF